MKSPFFRRMREHALAQGAQATRGRLSNPVSDPDPGEILTALYRHDRSVEPGRGGEEYVHVSSFVHNPKCARLLCLSRLMRMSGDTFSERLMGSKRLLWEYGRAAERHARHALLQDPKIKAAAYGLWKCKCGKAEVRGRLPATPVRCEDCRTLADHYHEATFLDPGTSTSANPDFIHWQKDAYTVTEFKSIKGGKTEGGTPGFDSMTAPQPTHIEQGCHYVHKLRTAGLPVHRKPVVVYVNKSFSFKEWYKALTPTSLQLEQAEEEVNRALSTTSAYRDYLDRLAAVDEAEWGTVTPPPRLNSCAADMESMRDKCPCWVECTAHQ